MKRIEAAVRRAPEREVTSEPRDVDHRKGGLLESALGMRQICRQLFGIPDYERYLAHAAAHHPGLPVLSRRDFCAQAIDRKYGKGGARCC